MSAGDLLVDPVALNQLHMRVSKITTDETPFFEKFYRKERDPDVYDHPDLPLSFDLNNICISCRESYRGKEY